MARSSIESLSVAVVSIPTRPNPPKDMTAYQKQIWKDVVLTKPPEWFESDSFPLLRAYCIASERHQKISQKLNKLKIENCKELLDMEEKQAKLIATLAVKMRLTQQSRYTPLSASTADKKAKGGGKPWEG